MAATTKRRSTEPASETRRLRPILFGLAGAAGLAWIILWLGGFFSTPKAVLEIRALVDAEIVKLDKVARNEIPYSGDWSSVGFEALLYNLGPMKIGGRVTISQRAHLCGGTHKFREASMPLVRAAITVDDEAWICADAFVGPGVTIGKRAVVGARAVVMRSVHEGKIMMGNPARETGER